MYTRTGLTTEQMQSAALQLKEAYPGSAKEIAHEPDSTWSFAVADDLSEWFSELDLSAMPASVLLAAAKAKRKAVIANGCTVTVDGVAIPAWADEQTIGILTARVARAAANPGLVVEQWQARGGAFFELNASDIAALLDGVLAFVDAAFRVQGELAAEIDAGNITSLDQIDQADWPPNG